MASSRARASGRVVRVGERGGGTLVLVSAMTDLVYVARPTYDSKLSLSLWSPLLHAVPIHLGHSEAGHDPAAMVPTITS